MINLNNTPSAVLELKEGDLVSVQGRELKTTVVGEKLCLTSTDSRVEEFALSGDHEVYRDYITHLRKSDQSQAALMTRQEMIDILVTGAYSIN